MALEMICATETELGRKTETCKLEPDFHRSFNAICKDDGLTDDGSLLNNFFVL